MEFEGKVWKFGDNVDTDVIIPARFLNVSDKGELARRCFADVIPGFSEKVHPGDIIVAGDNFGSGSSREHAPLAIKFAGIGVVVAKSFARIFYRNAFNIGLPILESPEADGFFEEADPIRVDITSGKIMGARNGQVLSAKPIPEFMRNIIDAGGLVAYTKKTRQMV